MHLNAWFESNPFLSSIKIKNIVTRNLSSLSINQSNQENLPQKTPEFLRQKSAIGLDPINTTRAKHQYHLALKTNKNNKIQKPCTSTLVRSRTEDPNPVIPRNRKISQQFLSNDRNSKGLMRHASFTAKLSTADQSRSEHPKMKKVSNPKIGLQTFTGTSKDDLEKEFDAKFKNRREHTSHASLHHRNRRSGIPTSPKYSSVRNHLRNFSPNRSAYTSLVNQSPKQSKMGRDHDQADQDIYASVFSDNQSQLSQISHYQNSLANDFEVLSKCSDNSSTVYTELCRRRHGSTNAHSKSTTNQTSPRRSRGRLGGSSVIYESINSKPKSKEMQSLDGIHKISNLNNDLR